MIQPLCPPVRCYLTASYLLSSLPWFYSLPSTILESPAEEEVLSSTTTTDGILTPLFPHGAELIAAFLTSIHCRVPADDVGMSG